MTKLPHGFAFGSCRMRFMPCRYCTTVLSSLAQTEYWLDVIEGVRQAPLDKLLREFICYEQAEAEPWKYSFDDVRSVIVEVCTAKTLWYTDAAGVMHPISLLRNHRQIEPIAAPVTLKVSTEAELYEEMRHLRDRLRDKFVVFVAQQSFQSDNFSLYWATAEIRHAIRDLVMRAANEFPACAGYDPTPRIAEYGATKCLRDLHHWTDEGGRIFAEDIVALIPLEYR